MHSERVGLFEEVCRQMELKDIYKNLLTKIRSETDIVEIKREYLLPQDSKYQYRRTLQSNGFKRPHILVYRKDKPGYLSTDTQFDEFFSECTDYLDELICMAHEFGHHFSPDHEIDSLYDKIRDNGNCATPDEKRRILEEESLAWDKAEAILKELKFSNWEAFHDSKKKGLRSYQQNIHEWQPLSIDEAIQTLKS